MMSVHHSDLHLGRQGYLHEPHNAADQPDSSPCLICGEGENLQDGARVDQEVEVAFLDDEHVEDIVVHSGARSILGGDVRHNISEQHVERMLMRSTPSARGSTVMIEARGTIVDMGVLGMVLYAYLRNMVVPCISRPAGAAGSVARCSL